MPIFIRLRLAAVRLARALRRSILTETKLWEIEADSQSHPCLVAGPFRVVIEPRAVRLFDALHVYCGGAEVWIPLAWRLRLRNALRLVLTENALELFDSTDLAVSRNKSGVARRQARQEQPA